MTTRLRLQTKGFERRRKVREIRGLENGEKKQETDVCRQFGLVNSTVQTI